MRVRTILEIMSSARYKKSNSINVTLRRPIYLVRRTKIKSFQEISRHLFGTKNHVLYAVVFFPGPREIISTNLFMSLAQASVSTYQGLSNNIIKVTIWK